VSVLLDNAYFRVTDGDPPGVVRLVRTAAPFTSNEALRLAALEVEQVLPSVAKDSGLLVDARDAPARNDAAFEEQFARSRRPILAHFARVAVLVRSSVGKLQVTRYGREDGATSQLVFDDEASAIAHLTRRR